MNLLRTDHLLLPLLLAAALAAPAANAWGAQRTCTYTSALETGGTGMGGTGAIARGTGMGGTGSPQIAGNVIASEGAVEARSGGLSRRLAQGDAVCVGETLVTAQAATVQVRMTDEGLVALSPQTALAIRKFVYKGTREDSSVMALLEGTSRIVTGKIGKRYPQNDIVETPDGVIGVRGTDHEATVLLRDTGGHPAGTYDKVNSGVTFIRTAKGEIDLHANQAGFAALGGAAPMVLKEIPDFSSASPAPGHESRSPEDRQREQPGEGKGAVEHAGEPDRAGHAPEAASSGEHPASSHDIEHMESPVHPELPEVGEFPEAPELPEPPELPGLNEQ